jgi:hypothetical protein
MDGIDNIVLNEICWIVQQRNEWAKRRQHYRNKVYRSQFISRSKFSNEERAQFILKFKEVNDERSALNVRTKRLRGLLKKINGVLRSDKNAGYDSIEYTIGNSDICKIIWRGEIGARAKDYEVDLYMANMFKGA